MLSSALSVFTISLEVLNGGANLKTNMVFQVSNENLKPMLEELGQIKTVQIDSIEFNIEWIQMGDLKSMS